MYFEFDDVRRIHQPYVDSYYRVPIWKAPGFNSPYYNWKRGMYAMSTAVFIMEPIRHFGSHVQIMNSFYEWPKTRQEYNIFFKEVFRLPDFWKELSKKVSFGLVAAGGDTAIKLATWQYVYGGTWSPQEYSDANSFKHLVCAMIAVTPTAGLTIPFENARRAYYADKTWPLELRKGYSSPLNALARIPFEEGPYYLFKGGFPHLTSQWVFWTGYFTLFSWAKNKFFFLWLYNDFNYNYIKFGMSAIAFGIASMTAYPLYFIREMVDIWPKERGGHCTWNNNYRQCAKWMIENMDTMYYNYLSGYWGWVRRYGLGYFIGLWMADNMGMFSNCNESHNSLEVQFPISSESV